MTEKQSLSGNNPFGSLDALNTVSEGHLFSSLEQFEKQWVIVQTHQQASKACFPRWLGDRVLEDLKSIQIVHILVRIKERT